MDVGKRIVELREKKQLSTNKLANISGISQSYLRDVESNKKNPTVEMLSYICYGLDVSLEEFFTEAQRPISPFLSSAIKLLTEEEQVKLSELIFLIKNKK